ncbi:hypothetical protein KY290_007885 [Solanum tuberosum]|uniref:Uncharacterized protein n=1 Tax=Solanum tuberosum TaxID=4113 RepID=A0ABQ7W8S8_SOLTU|nr:hypothetical protein KY290_007885 [Solanum tuberosum]
MGPILLFISFSCKPETTKSTIAMAFRKSSDFSYKDSTGVVATDLSHVGLITRRKFKNSGLDGSEYFTFLDMIKSNNSHMMVAIATPRGNLASVLSREFSQIGSNFGESEYSMDSPTSMSVNSLMADSTDIDEKFAMMEQTIEALKKSLDDKNRHIAQLMNKLVALTLGESSHVPTYRRSQIGATYVISSTYETKESKGEHNPAITQEHQTDEKVAPCCAATAFTDDDLL